MLLFVLLVLATRYATACQDQTFNCYQYTGYCQMPEYQSYLSQYCQNSCGYCQGQAQQGQYAYPQEYDQYFQSPQYGGGYAQGCNNYYCSGGYSGYCYGCYGGGFVGMVGYPAYYNQFGGIDILGGLLQGFQNIIAGIGAAISNALLNLGNLLASRNYANYGYGYGGNSYCIDYLPNCYMYLSQCMSPYSYYSSCMERYCPLTCGLCEYGAGGGVAPGGGGVVPNGGGGMVPNGGGIVPGLGGIPFIGK